MTGPEIQPMIEQLTDAAEAEWPVFRIDRAAFARRLMTAIGEQTADSATTLRKIHGADLYLAFACELGIPAALTAFAATYLASTDTYLKQFRNSSVRAEDVRSELEDTLLFGRKSPPGRIGQYQGRAPLRNFVARAARNAALTMLRSERRHVANDFDTLASQLAAPPAGSASIVAARYEDAVRDAVRNALVALGLRQRTIVRLHLLRGIPQTQIARMLKVHQTTVSRTFEAALHVIYDEIRRQLRELYGMTDSEMQSIIHDVRGRIELTWSRILSGTQSNVP